MGLTMELWGELSLASVKAAPTLVVAVITLVLGWLLGNGIATSWEDVKKRRALELEALGRFYQLYGEFYAVWKLWAVHKNPSKHLTAYERDPKVVWQLLERAAEVEGGFESLLVRVTQERCLEQPDIEKLARFRESYQSLRESIRIDAVLDWKADPSHGDPARKYQEFKRLAAHFAGLLSQTNYRITRRPRRPSTSEAASALVAATAVIHRGTWWKSAVTEPHEV